jgi:1,4-alpha-glucan branching enzyme
MNAKNKSKQSDNCCASQCVCLAITWPGAQAVSIAGSFNDWHPSVTPMIRLSGSQWAKELSLAPGRYEYRLVVDGEWVDDPAATELIPNPFGSANAVLEVRPATPAPSVRSPATARVDQSPKRTAEKLSPQPRASAQRGVSTSGAALSR